MIPKAMQRLEIETEAKLRAERDRLKASNAELIEALQTIIQSCVDLDEYIRTGIADNQQRRAYESIAIARAALAKASA